MRLIDIKRHIQIASDNFKPVLSNSGNYYFIDNLIQTKTGVQALFDSGILDVENPNEKIYKELLSSVVNKISIDSSRYNIYKKEFDKMLLIIDFMNKWINNYLPEESSETTVNIKLPQINDLSDFSASAICVKKAFSQVVSEIGGNIKVKQFDYGSYWLIIDVGVIEAVKLIGVIVSSAYAVTKGVLSLLKTYEELKALKLDNEIKITELHEKEFIQKKARREAEDIEKKFFQSGESNNIDNERCGRITVSITELVKLLRSGGEVHAALDAPKDIEEIYPKYNTSLSFTPIGLLSKKASEEVIENEDDQHPNT